MKTVMDFLNSKDLILAETLANVLIDYDAFTVMSVMGSICDKYAATHKDFNTAQALAVLSVTAKNVNDVFGDMEV